MLVDAEIWSIVGAPLLGGILVWLITGWVRSLFQWREARRARRRKIVSLLGRARSIAFRAIRDGLYDEAYIKNSPAPLDAVRHDYDDVTVEALDLFVRGEGEVAFWTAAEFYAGFWDPLEYLNRSGFPRNPHPEDWPLIPFEAEGESHVEDETGERVQSAGYILPRSNRLIGWAEGKDPGPRYGHMFRAGDMLRHAIVRPNSDVNMDMLLPPLWSGWGRGPKYPFRAEHWRWHLSSENKR